ncbi:MAG: PhzF family phenazine biosynthesis protein, partial [Eubacteriales bacterium]
MRYYIVDAFADKLFSGNPAGVCLLDEWINDSMMQSIAFENNLAETAFLVKKEGYYDLRWFTPEVEMDLCGHATLAGAFVLANFVDYSFINMNFHTQSGVLSVVKKGDLYIMDFPSRKPTPCAVPRGLEEALGATVLETHLSRDLLVLLESESTVATLQPDLNKLKNIEGAFAVIVTAKGDTCDFVSRFFAPGAGVAEDPVTGSSHCTLIPFWSERLGKTEMLARQLSKRGGTLYCWDNGERVEIGG